MTLTRKAASVLTIAVLATGLAGCGDSDSDSSAKKTMSAANPSADSSATAGDSSAGSGVSDEAWASKYKQIVKPLADKDDAEIVAAGKKVCEDWKADSTPEGAKKIIAGAESAWSIQSTTANIWAGGAIAHFCNDQSEPFIKAAVG